jgi:hypothetical protein
MWKEILNLFFTLQCSSRAKEVPSHERRKNKGISESPGEGQRTCHPSGDGVCRQL